MYILIVVYNYGDCLLKTTEVYNQNSDNEVIYIHKDRDEWLALSLNESEELIRELQIKTRELQEKIGLIKPIRSQSEEYRKSVSRAMREDEEE